MNSVCGGADRPRSIRPRDRTHNRRIGRHRHSLLETRFFCCVGLATCLSCAVLWHAPGHDRLRRHDAPGGLAAPDARPRPRGGGDGDDGTPTPPVLPRRPSFFSPASERRLHEGRVVAELSRRILSRRIALADVVLVAPDFAEARVLRGGGAPGDDRPRVDAGAAHAAQRYPPARAALAQGHALHVLPSRARLSDRNATGAARGWVLLAYFATHGAPRGQVGAPTIDRVLSPSRAGAWLRRTTVTYLVFPVAARAAVTVALSPSSAPEADVRDATVAVTGVAAAGTLLGADYKLQLLAASHHFDAPAADDGDDDGGAAARDYGPNALFPSTKVLRRFLHARAMRVLREEVRHVLRSPSHNDTPSGAHAWPRGDEVRLEVSFHALLFATQGLDLAIPSRSSYTDVGNHQVCRDPITGRRKDRCDAKLNSRAMNNTIFLDCPRRHDLLQLSFLDTTDLSGVWVSVKAQATPAQRRAIQQRRVNQRTPLEESHGILIDLKGNWLQQADVDTGEIEAWRGHADPGRAEAACARTNRRSLAPEVSCVTRIVRQPPLRRGLLPPADRPNLLLVLLDPLSRAQLRRSLPNTWTLLDRLGVAEFARYTAVGPNSGPNQAALYSGTPLGSRGDLRAAGNNVTRTWLWDALRAQGYVTLKAEDGCVSNSNMVQSIKPQTHHGEQLQEMFCFSYERPNCLGGKMAAEHLVEYARQFIAAYDRGDGTARTRPWAAFLSFIDSHEDTSTLISYLDGLLFDFLQRAMALKNTLIVFTSDHGLHYGPTFAARSGEAERAQPLLYVKLPSFERQRLNALRKNQQKYVTAFDVHATVLDILSVETPPATHEPKLGMSLVRALPGSRNFCRAIKAIPPEFCEAKRAPNARFTAQCQFMTEPPSIFSFYSDIPPRNRPRWPDRCPARENHAAHPDAQPCSCASSTGDWFDCTNITRRAFRMGATSPARHFSLRSCGYHDMDQTLELDLHVTMDNRVAKAAQRNWRQALAVAQATAASSKRHVETKDVDRPNILFLEIDSVSLSFSERFFPRTWELLQEHKILVQGGNISCPTGWCASMFNKTSVVGQSSIVNQLAALSGCTLEDMPGENMKYYKHGKPTYCPAGSGSSLGNNTRTKTKLDHWIFDVAKSLGYITFFGEEFCYEESPYVVQTQSSFNLDRVDFTTNRLFCLLAKNWLRVKGKVNSKIATWGVEYDTKEVPDTCFDGRSRGEISLEYIKQIWKAYDTLPKFAFLNALAAHDYSLDAAHAPLGAETYDKTIFRFLRNMMTRNDARDTFIILRSDHGLQGGPWPVDYATQIEHMHPWTAIIAPSNHQRLSLEPFMLNQNRLSTGYDIYNSIRSLMSPTLIDDGKQKAPLFEVGIPRWSYNLFQSHIPINRNCVDAKIPKTFCPCVDERSDMAPSFYVGYMEKPYLLVELKYDWRKLQFAPIKLPGRFMPAQKQSEHDAITLRTRDVPLPRCNVTLGSYIDEERLKESWRLIHNITSLYPGSDQSGGIFLYPRQIILLPYLVQRQIASKAPNYYEPFRVCETGFGAGHSAALFLASAPNVEVVSFDKYDRPYQLHSFLALQSYFGESRLKRVGGDSCSNVKKYMGECHFLHGSSLCRTDNLDLIGKSGPGVTLTSTAMNSLEDNSVYFGMNAQWTILLKQDCITNTICFQEEENILDVDLVFAKRQQQINHNFCFAVNTGTCGTNRKRSHFPLPWAKDDFCSNWLHPQLGNGPRYGPNKTHTK